MGVGSKAKIIAPMVLIGLGLLTACNQKPTRPMLVSMNGNAAESENSEQEIIEQGDPEGESESENENENETEMGSETGKEKEKESGTKPTTTPPANNETGKTEMPNPELPKEPTMRELITEAQFNLLAKDRVPFYTYNGFIEAAEATAGFAKEGSIEIRKREIAAMFAHARHESDEFRATREYNMAVWTHYCMQSAEYPCAAGQTYQGRGPIQLSWNYNYADAGKALGVDLLNNPDLVATNPKIAFQTLMWFWTKRGAITCHDAIVKNMGGFAQSTRTINGDLECNAAKSTPERLAQMRKRVEFYKESLKILGLEVPNEKLECL